MGAPIKEECVRSIEKRDYAVVKVAHIKLSREECA